MVERHAIDIDAADPKSRLVTAYDAFDRSALSGSHIHRDLIWLLHLFGALAVLYAVTGDAVHRAAEGLHRDAYSMLHHLGSILSYASGPDAMIELGLLGTIGIIVKWINARRLQERWIACRLGAEQARIALMCLPLFVTPDALATVDQRRVSGHRQHDADHAFPAIPGLKRAVREQGLPKVKSPVHHKKPRPG